MDGVDRPSDSGWARWLWGNAFWGCAAVGLGREGREAWAAAPSKGMQVEREEQTSLGFARDCRIDEPMLKNHGLRSEGVGPSSPASFSV